MERKPGLEPEYETEPELESEWKQEQIMPIQVRHNKGCPDSEVYSFLCRCSLMEIERLTLRCAELEQRLEECERGSNAGN